MSDNDPTLDDLADDGLVRYHRADRHPYQAALMAGVAVFAASYLILGRVPTRTGLDRTEVSLLAVSLLVGSVIALVGAFYPSRGDVRLGLQLGVIGQAALLGGFGYLALHHLTVVTQLSWRDNLAAVFTGNIALALTVAAVWRIWEGVTRLRAVNRYVEEHRDDVE